MNDYWGDETVCVSCSKLVRGRSCRYWHQCQRLSAEN